MVEAKVENTRQLDYPKDKLHLMWVTDGSTDDTNTRLREYSDIEIVYSPERRGKTAALNHGISLITSEITVMTDANTMVNREAIREMVRCLQDRRWPASLARSVCCRATRVRWQLKAKAYTGNTKAR